MKCNGRTCNNEAEIGKKACTRCREYRAAYRREHRKNAVEKTALGLCARTDCRNKADSGFSSCSSCREKSKQYEDTIRPELRETRQGYYYKVKDEVFLAYGGYKCVCCDITDKEFLSIDHIDGNGPTHRKEVNGDPRNGKNLYYWLRNNNFPPGFRVLCMNCNFSLGHHGYCPHNNGLTQKINLGHGKISDMLP